MCGTNKSGEKLATVADMRIAGLINEILLRWGDTNSNGLQGVVESFPKPAEEQEHQDVWTGCHGHSGSHQGLAAAVAKDVLALANNWRLTQMECYFPVKADNKHNCALCYHTKQGSDGERRLVWACQECNVRLQVLECFQEWHTKSNPKSSMVCLK